jgi:gamma-glutamyltranspeptidase / glutathione hydrolase
MNGQLGWDLPYASRRAPVFARNVVTTTQPLAAQAGLRMLQQGGNAVDAAVATAIALTVVEPVSIGIGGDAFALVWTGSGLAGLNASGRVPKSWTPMQRYSCGALGDSMGWASVTVPSVVSGWVALSERFGRLPFPTLFAPAIEYARSGFLVTPTVARQWKGLIRVYSDFPDIIRCFFPDGKAPDIGSVFKLPEQADTFETIATTRGEAFYRGAIAEKIVRHAQSGGGVLSRDDLESHTADWVEPLSVQYKDVTLYELPPNAQGLAALIGLGILNHHDVSRFEPDSWEALHIQIEAMKLAFADVYAHVADPQFMNRDPQEFLARAYLESRADLISMSEARHPGSGLPASGGTTYVAAADQDGMVVSFIQSNGRGFGSGIIVPGTGITLQNRARAFVDIDNHPNAIGPGKRPFHTNIPAIVLKDGRPLVSLGLMGWNMQPQAHVQFITRLLDHHQNPQAVLDAPRWRIAAQEPAIVLEPAFDPKIAVRLAQVGHQIVETEKFIPGSTPFGSHLLFGAAQMIYALEDGYVAASDPRRDGQAVGF